MLFIHQLASLNTTLVTTSDLASLLSFSRRNPVGSQARTIKIPPENSALRSSSSWLHLERPPMPRINQDQMQESPHLVIIHSLQDQSVKSVAGTQRSPRLPTTWRTLQLTLMPVPAGGEPKGRWLRVDPAERGLATRCSSASSSPRTGHQKGGFYILCQTGGFFELLWSGLDLWTLLPTETQPETPKSNTACRIIQLWWQYWEG